MYDFVYSDNSASNIALGIGLSLLDIVVCFSFIV